MQRSILVVLACVGSATAQATTPTWGLVRSATWSYVSERAHAVAGPVTVSSAKVQGIDCYRGQAAVVAPVELLLEIVADVTQVPRWSSSGLRESVLLSRTGDTLRYYQYLSVPGWTFASDRFWFVESRIEREGSAAIMHWDRMPEGGAYNDVFQKVQAANPSAIEPPVNLGGWVFDDVPEGGSSVTYYVCSDTGGSLPGPVQSAATRSTLPDVVGDLIREAKRRLEK